MSKNICTRRKKSNSHYAPQPYTNQSVFKSLLNCTSEISLSRNATGREFQRHGPATEKLSPRRVRVLFVAHVKTSADVVSLDVVQVVCTGPGHPGRLPPSTIPNTNDFSSRSSEILQIWPNSGSPPQTVKTENINETKQAPHDCQSSSAGIREKFCIV